MKNFIRFKILYIAVVCICALAVCLMGASIIRQSETEAVWLPQTMHERIVNFGSAGQDAAAGLIPLHVPMPISNRIFTVNGGALYEFVGDHDHLCAYAQISDILAHDARSAFEVANGGHSDVLPLAPTLIASLALLLITFAVLGHGLRAKRNTF